MSYTRYWAIFNRWYIPVHFYTSDIHPVHVVYTVLGNIQPLIHSLYTFTHKTYIVHMSYTRYWAIFKRWYIAYTVLYIRHTPCTCRIHCIGPYSTRWYIAYTLLYIRHTPCTCRIHGICHIQPLIHSLYTFIHQTYTLYMSYTRYWAIFNRWYIPCTLLYIRHTPVHVVYKVLGHIQPVIHDLYTFIHQTYKLYMSYTQVLGHIQPLIHSLYTFIHQTYTLYMSYTRYWEIFNHWYIAYTLLYIRHTPCTCRIHGIGPYSTFDT